MTKVLVVETNVNHFAGTDQATGLWLGESAEFVDELQQHGVEVDYVSPNGGFVPLDPRGLGSTDAAILKVYSDPDFIERALVHTKKPEDVNAADYDAIYYTGGHAVMWDFPDNEPLQAIARDIYANGGFVSSVCHGVAGLFNIKDADGNYLIDGKKITGFTEDEEKLAEKRDLVPFLNKERAEAHGATFVEEKAFTPYALRDGQLITGQNNNSARETAKVLLEALGK